MSVVIYMFIEGPKKLSAYLGPCPTCVPSLAPVAVVLAEKNFFEIFPTLREGNNLGKIRQKSRKIFFFEI